VDGAEGVLTGYLDRMIVGWHAVFVGLVVVTGVVVNVGAVATTDRVVALVALALSLVWYWLFGRRNFEPARGASRGRGIVYLFGLYVVCWVVVAVSNSAYLLLFVAFPQTWGILDRTRDAFAGSLVLVTGLIFVMASGEHSTSWLVAVAIGAVQLALSVLLGIWINGIANESQARAELIRELERTQAELSAVSHQAGVLAERERLAADIHDTLAQGFTSVLMLVQAAEADLDGNPVAVRHHLALAAQTARENLAEARSLVTVLAPPTLDGGLPAAVCRLVSRFGQEMGVESTVDIDGTPLVLPANREVVLLRASQEALANIRKHAGASTVAVRLVYGEQCAELIVRDDGGGFDVGAATDGYGLAGMRTRLEQVGGSLTVASSAGGTTLRASVPA
jgi:signal transduction histidine kinase